MFRCESIGSRKPKPIWLTGSDDCSVRLWDLSEEKMSCCARGSFGACQIACFFPNLFMAPAGAAMALFGSGDRMGTRIFRPFVNRLRLSM